MSASPIRCPDIFWRASSHVIYLEFECVFQFVLRFSLSPIDQVQLGQLLAALAVIGFAG